MNDLGYNQLLNPNWSLKLIFICGENHREHIFDISTILVKDFILSHSFSQSPQILMVDNLILTTQSPPETLYFIQHMKF